VTVNLCTGIHSSSSVAADNGRAFTGIVAKPVLKAHWQECIPEDLHHVSTSNNGFQLRALTAGFHAQRMTWSLLMLYGRFLA
jgi:hypothetical protein